MHREADIVLNVVSAERSLSDGEDQESLGEVDDTEVLGPEFREFEVHIIKESDELGLDVAQEDDDSLLVKKLRDGPVSVWNLTHQGQEIQPGDRIYRVNGTTGTCDTLVSTIRGSKSLVMGIRRTCLLRVSIQKTADGRLGVDISQHSKCLRVLRIRSGPFSKWNQQNPFDQQVWASDEIVEVNGIHGTSADLLEAIKKSGDQINFVIKRPSRTDAFSQGLASKRSCPTTVESTRLAGQGENRYLKGEEDPHEEPPGGHFALWIE